MSQDLYKIQKDIPVPNSAIHRVYPFAEMEVGDSFAFEIDRHSTLRRSASYYGAKHGRKFHISVVNRRCWRVQ